MWDPCDPERSANSIQVDYPKADKINSLANLDPEELGARLGVLEMQGYVKTQSQMEIEGSSLPNGISAVGLTNQGKPALAGPRWGKEQWHIISNTSTSKGR
jgi:hypothetical protein